MGSRYERANRNLFSRGGREYVHFICGAAAQQLGVEPLQAVTAAELGTEVRRLTGIMRKRTRRLGKRVDALERAVRMELVGGAR